MYLLDAIGGGGILLKPDEILELSYSWGIGEDTNSIMEALALWQGLYQAKEINVFGYSLIVIQYLITNKHPNDMRLRKIHKKIKLLIKFVGNTKIFHILRDLYGQDDKETNEAVPSAQRNVEFEW